MNSMTGFGRAEQDTPQGRLSVELSSVNSRFMELSVRLPRSLYALEPKVRELLTPQIERGKLNVYVNLGESEIDGSQPLINVKVARAYARQLTKLKKDMKLSGELSVSDLLAVPEIMRPEKSEPEADKFEKVVLKLIGKAVKELKAMRQAEGKAMATDMQGRLDSMSPLIGQIEKRSRTAVEERTTRIKERVKELLEGQEPDGLRMEEEIAILAERSDVAEECTRLRSHIEQFDSALKSKEAVGRRLNFILQEMNREVNTIGSKCSDFDISSVVIQMKEEVERIREQVQNVE